MLSKTSQKEFNELIVLAALASCFKPDEAFLSLDQFWMRGFAPTEAYGKKWIAEFIARKIIDARLMDGALPGESFAKTLLIKNPAGIDLTPEKFTLRVLKKINGLIRTDFQFSLYLKEFFLDVAACECIEYANFYATRAQLTIVNESHINIRLKSLLLECEQPQVFMLIWRALKNIKEKDQDLQKINFSEIVNAASACYVKYQRLGIEIDRYHSPLSIKSSILSDFLKMVMSERENFYKERASM